MNILRAGAVALLVIITIAVANAQVPSVRKRMGLNGPVLTVRLEINQYSWQDSRWEHGASPIAA
ncbi:MAG TPA: hypothetical protein VJT15_01570 [Pyrinomonadaceae bacterium]|nr:hypothetical protein [Pyrinomonadaceae bacterium]